VNDFIRKFEQDLNGTLSGFDRLVFLGTLWRDRLTGIKGYLWAKGMGAKEFGTHAEHVSKRVKAAAVAEFEMAGRPTLYLNSGKTTNRRSLWRLPPETVSVKDRSAPFQPWNCAVHIALGKA